MSAPATASGNRYARGGVTVAIDRAGRVELGPRAYRGRLTGMLFETDKAFLLPGAMRGIRGLKRYYDEHPGLQVLVVGHTDTAASDAYNVTLSEERAASIAAFLQDKVEDWLAWYGAGKQGSKRWGLREDQYMLRTLEDAAGPFLDAAPSGSADAATAAAVERFQRWSNHARSTTLGVDGKIGEQTRRALITAYMGQDETSLPAGTVIKTHGCGEYHPEVKTADGVAEERNRRVEIFLFEGAIEPAPRKPCPGPGGCREYPIWVKRLVETRDLRDTAGEAVFSMVRDGKPAAGLSLVIRHPNGRDQVHVTDAKGEVRIVGYAGEVFHLRRVLEKEQALAVTKFAVGPHPAV